MTILDHECVDLPTPTGPMRTHVFRPAAAGHYPGVLLYSEIFQVTGPIRRTAAMLAGHGYVVAVPEIYHEYEEPGTALAYDAVGADRGNLLKVTKPVAAFDDDARVALSFLRGHFASTGRVGVMGICIGGHLALRAAMNPEVDACACFYPTDIHQGSLGAGKCDDTLGRVQLGEICAELLMIFGRQDPHIPYEGRRKIQQALHASGVRFQWMEFNAAHAFLRDEGPRYDPALARSCYGMVLELFGRRLAEGDREISAPRSNL
jgi:carboxymethylenebutenolidase